MQPSQFQPLQQDVNAVPLETHNEIVKELELTMNELIRCRQKVAHLIKENEELKSR